MKRKTWPPKILNKKETLAQVFTDIRYTRKNNEYFSDLFLKVIKEQGYNF